MAEKLKITVLTDQSSWMNNYNIQLASELEKLGHSVKLIHSKDDITEGDIAFFLSCFEIIRQDKLNLNKNNIVVHASKLPQGKGWSPMTWQILEGKNEIPITLFEATENVDAGDIYIQDNIFLDGTELIQEWQEKLGEKIIEMAVTYVKNYENIIPKPQQGKESFYAKRKPEDSMLNINKTIAEQFNLLRVVDNENYPAYFEIKGQKYKIKVEKYDK